MAKLSYSAIVSLDGYIADENGNFDWGEPSEQEHAFVNERERDVGTYLYGRRMYEVMTWWETVDTASEPDVIQDFADIWRAAEKIVYSRTLATVGTGKTRVEREFDPDEVRQLKRTSARNLSIGGAEIAGQALLAGLVDEIDVYVCPIVVGGGARYLPNGLSLELDLDDARTFENGVQYLHYLVRP